VLLFSLQGNVTIAIGSQHDGIQEWSNIFCD